MSAQLKLNVVFQSRVGDGVECTSEKILLHSADMKALKTKIGGYVLVEMPCSSGLFKAWPSKKAIAGTVTMHKLWQPNFPSDQRKLKASPMTSDCLAVESSAVELSLIGNSASNSNITESSSFNDLFRAMLHNVPIKVGALVGFTLRCESFALKVDVCESKHEVDTTHHNAFYFIKPSTVLNINNTNTATQAFKTGKSSIAGTEQLPMGLEALSAAVATTFAGYTTEVTSSLGIACLGLNCAHRLHNSESNGTVTAPSTGSRTAIELMRPPKGLILFGSPGTGKTSLMRGIVAALGCNYVELSHSVLLSRYEGDAERAVTRVFQEAASKAPCCVLIDNIDLLCYSRTAVGASELQKRIVACLLTLMDGLDAFDSNATGTVGTAGTNPSSNAGAKQKGVFVIGTTSRIGDIDAAVRRAGRIDQEIEIGVPSSADREAILLQLLVRSGVRIAPSNALSVAADHVTDYDLTESSVREVAKLAHGMVGSDLLSVVKEAFYLTLKNAGSLTKALNNEPIGSPAVVTASNTDLSGARVTGSKSTKGLGVEEIEVGVALLDPEDEVIGSLANEFADLDVEEDEENVTKQTFATKTVSEEIIAAPATPASPVLSTAPSELTTDSRRITASRPGAVTAAALRQAVSRVSPSALREVVIEVPCVRWTDIGGMEPVKQSLREVVEWPLLHPELFASLGIAPPKGVLLYGPPGCSKTLMAKALATESSMNFLAVRGPELLSKWLGESEKAVQALFRRARAAAPSIVFFDEIDALAGKRGDVSSGVSDRVLSQLLTELDGVHGLKQVIVIAATNRPDMLDPALIRPGRIDRKIYVPPPDEESRLQILRIELKKMPMEGEFDFSELVQLTSGFSGAEIVGACAEAAMLAIEAEAQSLRCEHLLQAIRSVKPQITPTMLQFYKSCAANL